MFSLFGGEKNCAIGVDFGTSAIKVVELSYKNQKAHLENYGWVDLGLMNPSSINGLSISDSLTSYNNKLQKYLQKLIKAVKFHSKGAYISLPGFSGLVTTIEFPNMNNEELEEAIRFEARKYIPISLDEVALDWEVVEKDEEKNKDVRANQENPSEVPSQNKNTESIFKRDLLKRNSAAPTKKEILLVGAPKSEVMKCGNMVKESGLDVKNVELELFSLVRSLVGTDPGCFLIIDIGSRITNIILAEKGKIKANRNIEGGGNEITSVIADSLNISKQRAEELKKEEKDLINSKEMSLSIPVLDIIASEATRIINASKEKINGRVDGIILSGGSSKMKGIDTYFTQKIGVQTSIGNPWRKVAYDDKLKPFVDKMGNSFSVALGLAFRGLEEYSRKS